ncbi:MAG: carboxypeptidase-like regulatory domain-containing protein [Thermoproteota archaeon]
MASISGTVYEQKVSQIGGMTYYDRGNPIANVKVTLDNSNVTYTSSSGVYSFSNISEGTHTLKFEKDGYQTTTVTFNTATTKVFDIYLTTTAYYQATAVPLQQCQDLEKQIADVRDKIANIVRDFNVYDKSLAADYYNKAWNIYYNAHANFGYTSDSLPKWKDALNQIQNLYNDLMSNYNNLVTQYIKVYLSSDYFTWTPKNASWSHSGDILICGDTGKLYYNASKNIQTLVSSLSGFNHKFDSNMISYLQSNGTKVYVPSDEDVKTWRISITTAEGLQAIKEADYYFSRAFDNDKSLFVDDASGENLNLHDFLYYKVKMTPDETDIFKKVYVEGYPSNMITAYKFFAGTPWMKINACEIESTVETLKKLNNYAKSLVTQLVDIANKHKPEVKQAADIYKSIPKGVPLTAEQEKTLEAVTKGTVSTPIQQETKPTPSPPAPVQQQIQPVKIATPTAPTITQTTTVPTTTVTQPQAQPVTTTTTTIRTEVLPQPQITDNTLEKLGFGALALLGLFFLLRGGKKKD